MDRLPCVKTGRNTAMLLLNNRRLHATANARQTTAKASSFRFSSFLVQNEDTNVKKGSLLNKAIIDRYLNQFLHVRLPKTLGRLYVLRWKLAYIWTFDIVDVLFNVFFLEIYTDLDCLLIIPFSMPNTPQNVEALRFFDLRRSFLFFKILLLPVIC